MRTIKRSSGSYQQDNEDLNAMDDLCVWTARDQEDLPEKFVDLFGEVIQKTGKRRK
jgi:hypothetical protein